MTEQPSIRKPQRRACELCDRREVWSDEAETWTIDSDDGEDAVGDPHCIHEWDINGAFLPYE